MMVTISLIQQYIDDSEQIFETEVIQAIYDKTRGRPGMVCALCHRLIQTKSDGCQPIEMADFDTMLKHFTAERLDKNILNIIQKAKEQRIFMSRVLFDDMSIPYTLDTPTISYLSAHGVIHNKHGFVDIPVPLYKGCLIAEFCREEEFQESDRSGYTK